MLNTRQSQIFSVLSWLGLSLAALLLGACATQGKMMDNLNKTLRGYEKAVRWAKFDAAYSYHKWNADQEASIPANMENIRVTKYESSSQRFDQQKLVMKQIITLHFYNTGDLRERSLKHHHEWKYFPENERWYLISDPIVFP